MHSLRTSGVVLAVLASAVGCSAPSTVDPSETAESDLSGKTKLGMVCGEALLSDDGRYALLNHCPRRDKPNDDGTLERLDFLTGGKTPVASYGHDDLVIATAARGASFAYAIARNVVRTTGLMPDWTLSGYEVATSAWTSAAPPTTVHSSVAANVGHAPSNLGVTGDGRRVWYSVPQTSGGDTGSLSFDILTAGGGVTRVPARGAPLVAPDDTALLFVAHRPTESAVFRVVTLGSGPTLLHTDVPVDFGAAQRGGYGPDTFFGFDGRRVLHPANDGVHGGFVDFDTITGRATFLATPYCAKHGSVDCVMPIRLLSTGDIAYAAFDGREQFVARMPRRAGGASTQLQGPIPRERLVNRRYSLDGLAMLTAEGNLEQPFTLASISLKTGAPSSARTVPVHVWPISTDAWDDGDPEKDRANFVAFRVGNDLDWFDTRTGATVGHVAYGPNEAPYWAKPNATGSFATAAGGCKLPSPEAGGRPLEGSFVVKLATNGTSQSLVGCTATAAVFSRNVPGRADVLVYEGGTRLDNQPYAHREYELYRVQ
jgi:hypothetical protein